MAWIIIRPLKESDYEDCQVDKQRCFSSGNLVLKTFCFYYRYLKETKQNIVIQLHKIHTKVSWTINSVSKAAVDKCVSSFAILYLDLDSILVYL